MTLRQIWTLGITSESISSSFLVMIINALSSMAEIFSVARVLVKKLVNEDIKLSGLQNNKSLHSPNLRDKKP